MSEPITLTYNSNTCRCGCEKEKSHKRNFRQGHDRRFMATMVNAELEGRMVRLSDLDGRRTPIDETPRAVVGLFLADAGVAQYNRYLDRAKNRKGRTTNTASKRSSDADDGLVFNVLMGCWEYDA